MPDPPAAAPRAVAMPPWIESAPPSPHRGRRILRRLAKGLLGAFLIVTAISLAVNVATRPPEEIDPPSGAYVHVGDALVHYERWGTHGSPIVLVPGFLEASVVWQRVGPLLGRHHVVYAIDLPGHGYTRYRGRMLLGDRADLVTGFAGAMRLRRPLLVGHSLGAAVVGSAALRHPSSMRGVVFADGDALPLSGDPNGPSRGGRWLRSAIAGSPYVTTLLRVGARWLTPAKAAIRSICGPRCPPTTDAFAGAWMRPLRQRSGERALRALITTNDNGLSARQIAAISVPAAIIWGTEDRSGGSLEATIENLHHPPRYEIRGAGHLSMLAAPETFAADVERALSALGS